MFGKTLVFIWTYRTYSLKTYVRTWTKGNQWVRSPHCGLSGEIGKYETLFLDMWSIGVKNLSRTLKVPVVE